MFESDIELKLADHTEQVAVIAKETIQKVYPHYYPSGAVQFFLDLYSEARIEEAMSSEEIYLAMVQGNIIGTGSIRKNEICRLFILPEYQGKGYGSRLMDLLETRVFENYSKAHVDASFPAESMYLKRGYQIISYEKIKIKNGDFLCYHTMEKEKSGELIYRKAGIEDIEMLVKTRIEVLRAANCLSDEMNMEFVEEQSREYYEESLQAETHTAYLVFDGKRFVGAGGISFFRVMPTWHNPTGQKAYIMNMYTKPDYRRKGIAYHTLELLVEEAKKRNVSHISLESTDMGRPLYERYGFVKMNDEMLLPGLFHRH